MRRLVVAAILIALVAGRFGQSVDAQQPPGSNEAPTAAKAESADEKAAQRGELYLKAEALRQAGKSAEALAVARESMRLALETFPAESGRTFASLNWFAEIAEEAHDWPTAERARRDALTWGQKHLGAEHWRTTDARLTLENVQLLQKLTDSDRAELDRAKQSNTEIVQLTNAWKFDEAIAKARSVLDVRRRILGVKHVDYATGVLNLAIILFNLGETEQAAPLFLEAVGAFRKSVGAQHPSYATALKQLAGSYHVEGNYASAMPLYDEALTIERQALGAGSSTYAGTLSDLASLHDSMGDDDQAELLYTRVIEILSETVGMRHPSYASALVSLAGVLVAKQDVGRAEALYREALAVQKAMLGDDSLEYGNGLQSLAVLYLRTGQYVRAEPLLIRALEIKKTVLGETHSQYASALNALGGLYQSMGEYERAEPFYLQATELRKRAFGESHPGYAVNLTNLAFLYSGMDRPDEAEALYRQGLAISRASLEAAAVVQSERQQLAMARPLRIQLDAYLSLASKSPGFAERVFGEVVLWKGATLVRQRGMRLASSDPAVAELFGKLQRTSAQLASLSRKPPETSQNAWRSQLVALTIEKEQLETQLSARSADFRRAMKRVVLEDVIAALPQDAVLVDYLEFTRGTPSKIKGGATTYVREMIAFVVQHADTPDKRVAMIPLGPVAPIGAAIDRWRKTFGVDDESAAAGLEMRRLVWQPIEDTLNISLTPGPSPARGEGSQAAALSPPTTHHSPRTLLVSTDGVLGRLPLGALPGRKAGNYLIEDHRLAMIPVPQLLPALVDGGETRAVDRELLLFGDVDYDAVPGGQTPSTPKRKQPRRPGDRAASPGDGRLFDSLQNTGGEIAAIQNLYARLFEVNTDDPRALVRGEAGEARFRELAPRYRHLHLATHGFFAEAEFRSADRNDGDEASPTRTQVVDREMIFPGYNPGLLSGLALAGANREPTAEGDDGILTSQEIGAMNLSGIDTVVLSACDTGLGETAGGEGLLGVQRAFQVAGARTTVASFWKVDDLVTRLLMERFYRNLWEGDMSRLDALREAQLYVLNNPQALRGSDPQPDDPKVRTNPRFWAAFTLSGDWR